MTRFHVRRFVSRCQAILALTLLFAVVAFSLAAAQVVPQRPLLTIDAAPSLEFPGSILVSGSGFTAGGDVFIGLYDQWGKQAYETRWVVASQPTYGLDGSLDPAAGYVSGGWVNEVFAIDCRSGIMIRAHDRASGIWTDVLDIEVYTSNCVPPRDDDRRTPD
jgi:hypothetical protein